MTKPRQEIPAGASVCRSQPVVTVAFVPVAGQVRRMQPVVVLVAVVLVGVLVARMLLVPVVVVLAGMRFAGLVDVLVVVVPVVGVVARGQLAVRLVEAIVFEAAVTVPVPGTAVHAGIRCRRRCPRRHGERDQH